MKITKQQAIDSLSQGKMVILKVISYQKEDLITYSEQDGLDCTANFDCVDDLINIADMIFLIKYEF